VTNHDESTQGETVADTPRPVRRRPTRAEVTLNATFTGLMAGVLTWLVIGQVEDPSTWGQVGVVAYALLTGAYLWSLAKLLKRRWAKEPVPAPPNGYVDRDGDRWIVRPDGSLAYAAGNGGVWPRDVVEREFGPLTPIQD
jgi:hypothetical protein